MGDEVSKHLAQLLGGEATAAAWLYDTFAPNLLRRLKHRYGYPGGLDAEDLLHDSFVFYFQGKGKVLRDFLERVPRNQRTIDRLERHLWDLACGVASNRRRSASSKKVVPIFEDQPETTGASTEVATLDRDLLSRLQQCLRQGRERIYLYFVLRYRDGFSPHEIVRLTGWSRKATYKLKQALNLAIEGCARSLGVDRS